MLHQGLLADRAAYRVFFSILTRDAPQFYGPRPQRGPQDKSRLLSERLISPQYTIFTPKSGRVTNKRAATMDRIFDVYDEEDLSSHF